MYIVVRSRVCEPTAANIKAESRGGRRSYQTWLSGTLSAGVRVQGLVPSPSPRGHTTWIPQSLGVIPWPCDMSVPVLYLPLSQLFIRHVEFVKKPADTTRSERLEESVPTIAGMFYVALWHLSLRTPPPPPLSFLPQQVHMLFTFYSLSVDGFYLQYKVPVEIYSVGSAWRRTFLYLLI